MAIHCWITCCLQSVSPSIITRNAADSCALSVAYLFSTRVLITNGGIYSTASAGRVLLIPNIASRAVLLVTPFFMTLVAWKLAANWLNASTHSESRLEWDGRTAGIESNVQPSASQVSAIRVWLDSPPHSIVLKFSHLVNVCATAGPMSIVSALRYMYTPPYTPARTNLLSYAVRVLITLLSLSYALSAVEGIWLHAVTLSTLLPLTTTRSPAQNFQLGRSIDDFCKQNPVYPACDGEQVLACSLQYQGNSCFDAQGALDILRGSNEATLTANNLSTTNVIKYTPDTFEPPSSSSLSSATTPATSTALLLPYLTDEDQAKLSYTAVTTGVRATCENLTPVCTVTVAQPVDGPETGSVLYSGCPGRPGLSQGSAGPLGPDAGWNITGEKHCKQFRF
jgi:hypothetical protein